MVNAAPGIRTSPSRSDNASCIEKVCRPSVQKTHGHGIVLEMPAHAQTTIFSLATVPGRSAVAVIRLSGIGAGPALDALAGHRPLPRHAAYRALKDPVSKTILDRALILWFPGPHSSTGDDVAELHIHGGRAVTKAVLEVLRHGWLTTGPRAREFASWAPANGF